MPVKIQLNLFGLLLSHSFNTQKSCVSVAFHRILNFILELKTIRKTFLSPFQKKQNKKKFQQFSFTFLKNSICLCNRSIFFSFLILQRALSCLIICNVIHEYGDAYDEIDFCFAVYFLQLLRKKKKHYFIHQCQTLSGKTRVSSSLSQSNFSSIMKFVINR